MLKDSLEVRGQRGFFTEEQEATEQTDEQQQAATSFRDIQMRSQMKNHLDFLFSLSLFFPPSSCSPRPLPPVRFDCRHEIQRTVKGQSRGGVATTTGYNKYLPTSRDGCRERRCHKGKKTWTRAGRWSLVGSGGAGEEKSIPANMLVEE